MKRLIAFFALFFATAAWAVDKPVACSGASCKVSVQARTSGNAQFTVADFVNQLLKIHGGTQTGGTYGSSATTVTIDATNDSSSIYGGIVWKPTGDGISTTNGEAFGIYGLTSGGNRKLDVTYDQSLIAEFSPVYGQALKGVTNGAAASAGFVGEVVDCSGSSGSTASLTTSNMCALSLTTGDWDVSCSAVVSGSSGLSAFKIGLTTTSTGMPAVDAKFANQFLANGGTNVGGTVGPTDILISGPATYYCTFQPNGATVAATGYGHARRMR